MNNLYCKINVETAWLLVLKLEVQRLITVVSMSSVIVFLLAETQYQHDTREVLFSRQWISCQICYLANQKSQK